MTTNSTKVDRRKRHFSSLVSNIRCQNKQENKQQTNNGTDTKILEICLFGKMVVKFLSGIKTTSTYKFVEHGDLAQGK